jgi:hypothetical protein
MIRKLPVATVLNAVALVGWQTVVSCAQTVDVASPSDETLSVQDPASTGPSVQTPTQENHAQQPPVDPIVDRIKYLHDRLRITPAQEALWANVAQVMRDNAKALTPIIKERVEHAKTGNAIDYLSSYQKLGETQLDSLKKFAVAFHALYDSLSEDQKKIADSVFRLGPTVAGGIPEQPEQLIAPAPYGSYPSYPALPAYPAYPPYPYYPPYSSYAYPGPWIWGPPFFGLGTSFFFFHEPRHFHHFRPPSVAGAAPVPPSRPVPPPQPVPPIRPLPPGGVGLMHR